MLKIKRWRFWCGCYRVNAIGLIVGAVICTLIQVILWCTVGSPLGMFYHLKGSVPLLPRWLYMILDLSIHAGLGAALGASLCDRRHCFEALKYRGAFYLLLAIVVGYLYYSFYFGIGFFLVALVLAAIEFLGLLIATLNLFRVIKISAIPSAIGCLWAIYRAFLSIFSLFSI